MRARAASALHSVFTELNGTKAGLPAREKYIMLGKLLQFLSLACKHRKTSQPVAAAVSTPRVATSAGWDPITPAGRHYVVCLDCGKKFDYDWKEMRIVS